MMNTRRETSIQVQTVLFCNDTYSLLRSLKHMANAVRVARQNGVEVHVRVAWGDASPEPLFDETALNEIRQKYSEELELDYTFFHRNTGTSLGHNTLAKNCTDEYLLVMNPDIVPSPTFFMEILKPFEHKGSTPVGAVEARQTMRTASFCTVMTLIFHSASVWQDIPCCISPVPLCIMINGWMRMAFGPRPKWKETIQQRRVFS